MTKPKKESVFSKGGTDEEKKDRFKAGGLLAMGTLLAGGLFTVAWMAFTPTILGPELMGLFGPMMGWFWVLGNVIALGVPQTITAFVSLHADLDMEESRRFIGDGNRLVLLNGIAALGVTAVGGGAAFALGAMSLYTYAMAVTLVASACAGMLFWAMNSVLNGFQRIDLVSVGNFLFPIGQFIGSVALILAARAVWGPDSRWLVVAAVAGLGVGQLFGLVPAMLMVRRTGHASVGEIYDLRRRQGLFVKILKFGGLAAVSMVALAVVQNLAAPLVRIVGLYWMLFGDTREACLAQIGYFSTALIFGMATMLLVGVAIALMPAVSDAEGKGRHDLVQEYYTGALQQCFTVLAVFIMIFAVYGGRIIQLMNGPQFPAAVMHPLALLSVIGGGGVALLFVLVHLFIGLKKPAAAAAVMGLVFMGLIAGIGYSSFAFRTVHAAMWGFMVPPVLGAAGSLLLLRVRYNLLFPWWTLLEPACCACLAAVPVALFMPDGGVALWFAGVGAMVAVFGAGLALLERRRKKSPAAQAA
jgi:O-antigen/teichoic acid export membrane protein